MPEVIKTVTFYQWYQCVCSGFKKPKKIDTFLYQHFKRTGHSSDNVLAQPVEKMIYDENSSVRFNTINRLETELKWIKSVQSASPLGFNDNIYQEGNISKMPDFDVFSLLEIRKRKRRSQQSVVHQKGCYACQWLDNVDMHRYAKFDQNIACGPRVMSIFTY